MLWTDAEIISTADLLSLDSEIQGVAQANDINIADAIRRGTDEAGAVLMQHVQQFGGYPSNGEVSANHYAAIMNTGLLNSNKSKLLLNQVVISPLPGQTWSPIKRWAAQWALVLFYRDAASRAQADRYRDKLDDCRKLLHSQYWHAVRALGVPYVSQPLPCPGAVFESDPGTWNAANAPLVNGTGTRTDVVTVQTTWVDGTKTVNNESAPSAALPVQLAAGKVLQVDISSLNPPTGAQPAATMPLCVMAYGKATAWALYVNGVRQVVTELSGSKQVTLTGDPATSGVKVGTGQYAELYLPLTQGSIQRG